MLTPGNLLFPRKLNSAVRRLALNSIAWKMGDGEHHLVLETLRHRWMWWFYLCMYPLKGWHWSFRLTFVLGKSSLGKASCTSFNYCHPLEGCHLGLRICCLFLMCCLFKPYYVSVIPVMKADGKTAFIENWSEKALPLGPAPALAHWHIMVLYEKRKSHTSKWGHRVGNPGVWLGSVIHRSIY